MTLTKQDILEDFYQGNSKDIHVTVTDADGQPLPLTGAEITYVIYTDDGKVTSIPVVKLTKSTNNGVGDIEITNEAEGIAVVHIYPYDTTFIFGSFNHMCNVVVNGDEETVFTGKINIFRAPARRSRNSKVLVYLSGTIV